MAAVISNLRLLDNSEAARGLDLASELFHRINRIIPQDQVVLTIEPTCKVRDAIALMRKHGYSQVPVVMSGEVLGVFSFRSFAFETASASLDDWSKQKCSPGDLQVDDMLEEFKFARVNEEMKNVFDAMDKDNGVLIGTPENLIGILTPMDFLKYLHQVASPFVMLSEIELALRALIHIALNPDQIVTVARRCLTSIYGSEDKVPTSLEDMTFDNYQSIVSFGDNWEAFEPVFSGTRTRTSAKLKEINEIRNDLFHFKREITMQDHQSLATHRNWLLSKVKQAGGCLKSEVSHD